jgi:hypothetical protein
MAGIPIVAVEPERSPQTAEGSMPQDCGIMAASSSRVLDARQLQANKRAAARKPRDYFGD